MPTRRISRALRRPSAAAHKVDAEPASYADLLNAIQQYDLPFLPVSAQPGHELIGRGLSGGIQQATADHAIDLAFKQGIPSRCERDDDQCQDWYSLITEIAVLQHPPLRENPHIIDILGVTFSVEPMSNTSRKAWPLLIMRKADLGDLANLLKLVQEQYLTTKFRLQFLAAIAEAVYLLHRNGVAHGDIKPNNFLVTLDVDDYGCIMTDFGSCVVQGQDRVPTLSPPWNAPELNGSSRSLGFEELCQTDLFSLGLVCIHLLIPSSLLKDEGLWFVRQQQSDSEWAEFINLTNQLKQPETIATSLVRKLKKLVFSLCEIPENHKSLLVNLMENVMLPPNGQRSMPWDDIFGLVNDELSTSTCPISDYSAEPPKLTYSPISKHHEAHVSFNLGSLLGELDDTDYVVRQDIVHDLEFKARYTACPHCREAHVFNLALCYEIALGGLGGDEKNQQRLTESKKSEEDMNEAINQIGMEYEGRNRVPRRILQGMGIEVLTTSDRMLEYQLSRRLPEAETVLKTEIEARTRVFGPHHRCLPRLQTELARVLRILNRYADAEEYQRKVVENLLREYGDKYPSLITARLNLADTYVGQGIYEKAAPIFEKELPRLVEILGQDHPDVLTARALQAHAESKQGRFEEAKNNLRSVISRLVKVLSPRHRSILTKEIHLFDVLRASGDFSEAYNLLEEVINRLGTNFEGDHLAKLELLNRQALLCAEMMLPEEAVEKADAVKALVERLNLEEDNGLRLSTYEVRAAVHCAIYEFDKAETLLYLKQAALSSDEAKDELLTSQLIKAFSKAEGRFQSSNDSESSSFEVNSTDDIWSEQIRQLDFDTNISSISTPVGIQQVDSRTSSQSSLSDVRETMNHQVVRLQDQSIISTIQSILALGYAYNKQGEFEETVELWEEALLWAQDALEDNHPKMIQVMSDLAIVYGDCGRLQDAKELFEKIRPRVDELAGESLETYAARLVGMGRVYFRDRNFEEAERLERKAHGIRTTIYAADHGAIRSGRKNLATTLSALGRHSEAEVYFRENLAAYESEARDNPGAIMQTIYTRIDLGAVLYLQNKLSQSLTVLSEALEASKEVQILPEAAIQLREGIQKVNHSSQMPEVGHDRLG